MFLEIKRLFKSYSKKEVLKDVNLCLESGIYGLLGPNGAGKSTLINILVTALPASSGEVLWNGEDIHIKGNGFLNVLGYVPQTGAFYNHYTANEFLRYIAALKGVREPDEKIDELLRFVNLTEEKNNKIKTFSGGMKQRLGIAQALINDPKILILDEPTAGLDPQERIRIRNLISKIAEDRIILISTHIVPDIEYIANRVILLKNGAAFRNAPPSDLTREIEGCVWRVSTTEARLNDFLGVYKIVNVYREENSFVLRIVSDKKPCPEAEPLFPGLEDVYLYHFGEVTV